jgi:hypothetical protein
MWQYKAMTTDQAVTNVSALKWLSTVFYPFLGTFVRIAKIACYLLLRSVLLSVRSNHLTDFREI